MIEEKARNDDLMRMMKLKQHGFYCSQILVSMGLEDQERQPRSGPPRTAWQAARACRETRGALAGSLPVGPVFRQRSC